MGFPHGSLGWFVVYDYFSVWGAIGWYANLYCPSRMLNAYCPCVWIGRIMLSVISAWSRRRSHWFTGKFGWTDSIPAKKWFSMFGFLFQMHSEDVHGVESTDIGCCGVCCKSVMGMVPHYLASSVECGFPDLLSNCGCIGRPSWVLQWCDFWWEQLRWYCGVVHMLS